MQSEISVLLGGRVAERLVLNDISTGASNDIQRATALARNMVIKYGMSEKVGLINYGSDNDEVFLGRDYGHTRNFSEQSAALIDRLLKAYFMEGQNIGDYAVLERAGLECGLERESLAAHIAASQRLADPTGQRAPYAEPQVNGVPYFVFNTGYSLSGVYSPVAMAGAMALAVAH